MSKIIQISGGKAKGAKSKRTADACVVRDQRTGQFSPAKADARREMIIGDSAKRFGPALKDLSKR